MDVSLGRMPGCQGAKMAEVLVAAEGLAPARAREVTRAWAILLYKVVYILHALGQGLPVLYS